MHIFSPLFALTLLLTTAITSPTPAPADLANEIIAIEDGAATPCRCVRSCYNNMKAYCDSCATIADPWM
ncbi:hypothetical protein ONS95_000110 [Cadophora gregata]|uniref:uncharacterized protein n=1 Tax=Cadophora gregata TaxID=51156 RepID=UPI0026DACA6F|nr:uncharacterized protein ONS95_000110 [Cadophora gregata]KAK0128126.1 hypothetical protein ONS95_000110 [Cadophora gregata]